MTSPRYQDMTQAELDRAYSPSSMVPSIEPFLRRYSADSAAARARHDPTRWSTETYGAAPSQSLDVFRPLSHAPAALLVFIHGGYWQALHKDDASFPASAITGAGFAYAAVNYTLAPAARMDAIVEECRCALEYLWTNRARLGIDAGGIVLSGHSAGAHLAAMMMTTNWSERGVDPSFIQGALLLGGVFDLAPIRQSYVNEVLGMDADEAARNSPVFKVPRVQCPVVVTWAERDTEEFKRQSRALAAAWRTRTADLTQFEQPNVNHFDSLFDWYDPESQLTRETHRLLRTRR